MRTRFGRFFFDAQGKTVGVELDHAVAFWVADRVGEDQGASFQPRCRLETFCQSLTVEQGRPGSDGCPAATLGDQGVCPTARFACSA